MSQNLMTAQLHTTQNVITDEGAQRVLITNGVKSLFITTNEVGHFLIRVESNNDARDFINFSIMGNTVIAK